MMRGTTPTHQFVLPIGVEMVKSLEIIYKQNDKEILKKTKEDCKLTENTIEVTLSQQDTFKFTQNVVVEIQLRVLTTGGNVPKTPIYRVSCDRCLSDEVLT